MAGALANHQPVTKDVIITFEASNGESGETCVRRFATYGIKG